MQLYDPATDDFYEPAPLYDPRRRRRSGSHSYHPRRRHFKRRHRFLYDPAPRFRRARRVYGRLRRYRSGRRTSSLIGRFTTKKASTGWGALSFLWAINQNVQAPSNLTFADRLQAFFIGIPYLRLSGSNAAMPKNWGASNVQVQFNPSKALNKLTIAGILATMYGYLAPPGMPMRGLAKRIGPAVAIGAGFGGGFDPPGQVTSTAPRVISHPASTSLPAPTSYGSIGQSSTGGFTSPGLHA